MRTAQQEYAIQQQLAKGRAAERSVAHIVQGIVTTVANGQNDDIDVIGRKYSKKDNEWKDIGYSVKDIKSMTKKLGNRAGLILENKLIDSRTNESMLGWAHTSKADWFVYRVWLNDKDQLLFVKKDFITQWTRDNINKCQRKTLGSYEAAANRASGRKYDTTENIILPLNVIMEDWELNKNYFLYDYIKA